ncbi:MAG: hypothetical protein ABUS48_04530 [Pseudomonadota bacterium]
MRVRGLLLAAALAGCVTPAAPPPHVERTMLTPADAATGLLAGGALTLSLSTPANQPAGDDPVINMTLATADGRALGFTEANHAPYDVMAQTAGGPLAQAMGLFGEEAPKLYAANATQNHGAPFLCGPDGPAYVGVYAAPDGSETIVALKSGFDFEAQSDGSYLPIPFSPDHVCARMKFRRG